MFKGGDCSSSSRVKSSDGSGEPGTSVVQCLACDLKVAKLSEVLLSLTLAKLYGL